MPLFLGYRTAELLLDKLLEHPLRPAEGQGLEHCWSAKADISQLDLKPLKGIPRPLDVLVSDRARLTSWEGVRCHLCTPNLPYGSFLEVGDNIFVASPPLCLLQRSKSLSLAQSASLASRFCGTFALDKSSPTGVRKRTPLTTKENLALYLDYCKFANGVRKARRAARLAIPYAASPMEAITALAYCLPTRLSGLGLVMPSLNYEVTLSSAAQRLVNKKCIRIDLYWKDFSFGLEYQGEFSHSDESKIAADIARQLAARERGIEIQFMTIEQLRDQDQRMAIARMICSHIGGHVRTDQRLMLANQRLVDDLLFQLSD